MATAHALPTPTATGSGHAGRGWIIAAGLLAVLAGLFLALAPLNNEVARSVTTTTSDTSATSRDDTGIGARPVHRSLVASEGWGVVALLALPVAVCLLPLLGTARARPVLAGVAFVLLGLCVMLGWLSLGIFYLPSTAAMLVAAIRSAGDVEAEPV